MPGIASSQARCTATNKRGEPCRSWATANGLCSVHAGLVDPKTIGAKGGSRKLSEKARASARVRAKAYRRMHELLDSPDERIRLRAASHLTTYAGPPPPTEYVAGVVRHDRGLGLADVEAWLADLGARKEMPREKPPVVVPPVEDETAARERDEAEAAEAERQRLAAEDYEYRVRNAEAIARGLVPPHLHGDHVDQAS